MSDAQKSPNPRAQDDTTRAVAQLPGLEIEVVHRRAANAEAISIHLTAMPSFEAFGRFLESELWAKPYGNALANPFALWAEAARLMWQPWFLFPWLGAARALLPPGGADEAPRQLPEG